MSFKLRIFFMHSNTFFSLPNLLISALIFNHVSCDPLDSIKTKTLSKVWLIYQFVDLSTDFACFPHFHQEVICFQILYCKVTVPFGCSCKNNSHNCNSLWFSCYVLQIKFFQRIKIIFIFDVLMYPFEEWFYFIYLNLFLEKVSSKFYSYFFKSKDKNFYV